MIVRPRCSLSGLIALAFVMGGGSQAQAQQASAPAPRDAPPVALPGTEQFDLVSAVNGEPYRLFVSLPEGYEAEGGARYPVLYLLDAHPTFPAAVSAVASMAIQNEVEARADGRIPQLLAELVFTVVPGAGVEPAKSDSSRGF